MSFELPKLNYAFDALEPHFDKVTMEIHYGKHHQTYITNLNNAIMNTEYQNKSLIELIKICHTISPVVRNNAGGHWNHSLFWEILSPNPKPLLNGKLFDAINKTFGGINELKEKLNQGGLSRFGSGWVWLIVQNGILSVCSTPNQDNPLMEFAEIKGQPIIGIDVWEHAYYLKYQNRRADYLTAFWNLLDWQVVERKYLLSL